MLYGLLVSDVKWMGETILVISSSISAVEGMFDDNTELSDII